MAIAKICDKFIEYSFYILFALVPLFFTPFNFELFEFNKMWATFALTIVIVASWFIKMVKQGEIKFQKTPLDLPILLFLGSQLVSTIFSIDVHTSLWGYYSRFNGSLLSIISYILLYYAFVSNFSINKAKVRNVLVVSLITGALVAVGGVFEHFGIDSQIWQQDVKNRVFSTLGQPNWLAAYMSILIPISIAFAVRGSSRIFRALMCLLPLLFYLTLLYTKSRSGFAGFWIGMAFFFGTYIWYNRRLIKKLTFKNLNWLVPTKPLGEVGYLLAAFVVFLGITFLVGSPFEQINKFTLKGIASETRNQKPEVNQNTVLETGGTDSGEIRKIVWQGALAVAKNNPLFGTGVETFAFAYYKYRPAAHNLTSEWDFLYNKAHNEYLNYFATTGLLGLGTYLFIIVWFFKSDYIWITKKPNDFFALALVASYISILVSNFFGFSVVLVNLYFFLIPAMFLTLVGQDNKNQFILKSVESLKIRRLSFIQAINIVAIIIFAYFLLLNLALFWIADVDYARGSAYDKSGQFEKGYEHLLSAISKRADEPIFRDELAVNSAILSTAFYIQDDATTSAQLADMAVNLSRNIVKEHPNNINFWKSQARIFYTLSGIDEKYLADTVNALEQARSLAPTDPKITYNLALLYGQQNKLDLALKTLEETVALKSDYRDARFALGLFYDETSQRQKAIEEMDFIIKNIATQDAEATQKLLEWRGY